MSQSTPQFVKTVVQEIMKVESSKQIHSLACCSMTVDSKSQTQHLVVPAISTEFPIILEKTHRRLNQEEQRALDLTSEKDRETARTMVSVCTSSWSF